MAAPVEPAERRIPMPGETIEHWQQTQAELEIRRWLSKIGLWAPGAERYGWQPQDAEPPAALTAEQIDQVLRSEVVGRIGCHAEGKTYVVPIAYVYDGQHIYGHTGGGLKLRMLRANPDVCFEVDHIVSLSNWQSVIAWGQFEELHGAEADRAVRLLAERIRPLVGDDERQIADDAARGETMDEQRPVVYRISLTEVTGRADQRT
jgi:nitroimidazol reductase NimA-like FMN-containing flavoprotein (pyridoxamine 5'-phosphate oxidase superfamily)